MSADFWAAKRRAAGIGDPAIEALLDDIDRETARPGPGGRADGADDEDVPIPLDEHAPQPMPAGLFTGWHGAMVEAVSAATETPRELAAMVSLSVLAAACQGRFRVEVEIGYREPVNVWAVVALDPGNRKTAVFGAMARPLYDWERDRAAAMAAEIARAAVETEAIDARVKELRARYAKAKDEDLVGIKASLMALEADRPEIPASPRIVAQDVTPEHLGTLLAQHEERMSLLSDEGGIFDILAGRYSRGVPNLDLFLQAHAGAPVRVDRGSREPVHLHRPALTIGLSPQPEVLRGLAGQPGFRGRGLLARFLYALPVSNLGFRTLVSSPVPESVERAYSSAVRALLNIEPPTEEDGSSQPYILRLAPAALREWKAFQRTVETELREGGRLEHITDWGAKLPGAVARVAALLHCVEHAHGRPESAPVAEGTMGRALALAAVLVDHALAVFDLMGGDPALAAARKVWRWVERGRQARFSVRECHQGLRGTFPKRADLDPALAILVDRGYITECDEPRQGVGRPSRTYRVHPALAEGWR